MTGTTIPIPGRFRKGWRRGCSRRGRRDHALDLRHVAAGGGGSLIRAASALPGVHVRGVPVPPVVLWGDLLVRVVPLGRFVQQVCQRGDVHVSPPTPARAAWS